MLISRKRSRARTRRRTVNKSIVKKANYFYEHFNFRRINVPPHGDFLPQVRMVDNFNCTRKLNKDKEKNLSHFKWSLSNFHSNDKTLPHREKNGKWRNYSVGYDLTTNLFMNLDERSVITNHINKIIICIRPFRSNDGSSKVEMHAHVPMEGNV